MIQAIGTAIKLFGVGKSLAVTGAVLLMLSAAYGVWHYKVYQRGYQRALADIAAEDRQAIAGATELRKTFRACRERAGRWIQSEGKCS